MNRSTKGTSMKLNTVSVAICAVLVLARVLGACVAIDTEDELTSLGDMHYVEFESDPDTCPTSPAGWRGRGRYPAKELSIGSRVYDVADLLETPSRKDSREALVQNIGAVYLNLAIGADTGDDALLAIGELDLWLVATELSQDAKVPFPSAAGSDLRAHLDSLRPCTQQSEQRVAR